MIEFSPLWAERGIWATGATGMPCSKMGNYKNKETQNG
jgi:hypothetical protein